MTIDYDGATTLFAIAANEIRLRIMLEIAREERTVNDLAEAVGMSQSPVSQHLAKLRGADLVEWRRDGVNTYYHLRPGVGQSLIRFSRENFTRPSQTE
ncbi:ArsR/SmtB family transcription factor [Rhizobium wenxiniae]|uniref:ArsR/SmtB family transcription factor n=1 Tax=Rhizobium wenxiniae TaxID=1737357 RepID=UPI003C272F70